MKIFICWSGRRGERAANALKDWLLEAFPGRIDPEVSTGIEKGAPWQDRLWKSLSGAQAGLLCLTPEALQSSWVSYEGGVLSRAIAAPDGDAGVEPAGPSRLFTFLWGVKSSELAGPLGSFQATDASDKADVCRLLQGLVALMGRERAAETCDALHNRWEELWESLRERLASIPPASLPEIDPGFEGLFRRKTFEEPIQDCVDQRWLDRYRGVIETLLRIRERRPAIERACRSYVVELFHLLEQELDAYAMAISVLVRKGDSFALDGDGDVEIAPPGLLAACERRRRRVRDLVARLVDPEQAPFCDRAVRFRVAEEPAERMTLVHRLLPDVERLARALGKDELPASWPAEAFCFSLLMARRVGRRSATFEKDVGPTIDLEARWRTSEWELDRIMYALCLARRIELADDPTSLCHRALDLAELELEKAQALEPMKAAADCGPRRAAHASLTTLHYTLSPLKNVHKAKHEVDVGRVQRLLDGVTAFLEKRKSDDDGPLRATLAEIRQRMAQLPGRAAPPPSSPPEPADGRYNPSAAS